MSQVYFDSTALPEPDLRQARIAATEQNEIVLEIMHCARRPLTPWEVWQKGIDSGAKWLITSVRRSMTVLSDGGDGNIVKGPHPDWKQVQYAYLHPAPAEVAEALIAAGKKMDAAMDMQEKRESGDFHINAPAARAIWDEARRDWAAALCAGGGNGT